MKYHIRHILDKWVLFDTDKWYHIELIKKTTDTGDEMLKYLDLLAEDWSRYF